jgi:hypothetical protein
MIPVGEVLNTFAAIATALLLSPDDDERSPHAPIKITRIAVTSTHRINASSYWDIDFMLLSVTRLRLLENKPAELLVADENFKSQKRTPAVRR